MPVIQIRCKKVHENITNWSRIHYWKDDIILQELFKIIGDGFTSGWNRKKMGEPHSFHLSHLESFPSLCITTHFSCYFLKTSVNLAHGGKVKEKECIWKH